MKNLFLFVSAAFLMIGCSEEKNDMRVTAKTVMNTPNVKQFKSIAAAIDNLEVGGKVGLEDQLGRYLDPDDSKGIKLALENAKLANKKVVTAKEGYENQAVDLDKELSEVGFTDVQKEFISKITALYPLENSDNEKVVDDDLIVRNIKEGLLGLRNEVFSDARLNTIQKEQIYVYIDLQYTTLDSIVNYAERVVSTTQTGKWKISFKKIVNIVVSVVVTVAVTAVITVAKAPTNIALIVGGCAGFVSGVLSASNNNCIKICGTGYCDTSFNDCYSRNYLTAFSPSYEN